MKILDLILRFGLRFTLHRIYQLAFHLPLRGLQPYTDSVLGKCGLEIGGPSGVFARKGLIPIYDSVGSLDNCNFGFQTLWAAHASGKTFAYSDRKPLGHQYIAEGMDLAEFADESYDFILSSHMLEHTANPLRALRAWHRVLRRNGRLILLVPDPKWTFDHKRQVTTLDHLIHDLEYATEESDQTHLPEILKLHDLSRDAGVESYGAFKLRCEENLEHRGMHHHVFSPRLIESMLNYSRFSVLSVRAAFKDHIITIAEKLS